MRVFGSRKSKDDSRDLPYVSRRAGLLDLPPPSRIDRSGALPPCWDQGTLSSCEAHAGAGKLYELYPGFTGSRLAIYFKGRSIEGTLTTDAGMETRDLMKVLQAGVIPESEWPYDQSRFTEAPPPFSDVRIIGAYSRISGRDDLIDHLAHDGCVVLSFCVPSGFPTFDSGSQDWHCVLAVGYDLPRDALWVRNSWGPTWNKSGYFWMPIPWTVAPETGDDMWAAQVAPAGTVAGVSVAGAFQSGPLSPPA